jgi:hypothetical protein
VGLVIGRAAATALVCALAGSVCPASSDAAPSRPTAVPRPATAAVAPTPRERQMEAIVTAWSTRLNARDNRGIAELFAVPATIIQGPYAYRLVNRHEIALWFSLLPCSGKIVSISYSKNTATAVFLLGNRGSTPCDGPGTLAAARFEFAHGRIVVWEQVPVPAGQTNPRLA